MTQQIADMVTHYSTLSAADFTKLFDSCKSYHEHMLKVAVSYADVRDDETMFEWLLSYFDLFFPKSIPKSSSLDDIIEASPYGKAVS